MPSASIHGKPRVKPKTHAPVSPASAEAEVAPLLGAICHDLRAPLAAVTMGVNFLLQTTRDEDATSRQRRILDAMLRSCGQMERLVRNFADLSEIESGAVTLRLAPHDAGEMVELTIAAASERAESKGLVLAFQKPEAPLTIRCDRERVLRALAHLVDNALKFGPSDDVIDLSVVREGADASFRVTNRGPGVPDEVTAFLAHPSADKVRVGKGFGLAIVRGFARAHEGRLTVESSREERTTFSLRLPIDGPKGSGESVPSSARAFPIAASTKQATTPSRKARSVSRKAPKRRSPRPA